MVNSETLETRINNALEKITSRVIFVIFLLVAIIVIAALTTYWGIFLAFLLAVALILVILLPVLWFAGVFEKTGSNNRTQPTDNLTRNEMRDKMYDKETAGDNEMTQKQMREHNKELEAFKKKVDEHNKEVQALKEEVDDICLGLEDVTGVFADLGDSQGLRLLRDALVDVLNGAIDAADKRRAELRK
jgi:ABC-type transport system involved in cytochrome bd biosynthesis fused ATPase/permease subunit